MQKKITDGALKEAAEKWLEAFDSNEESKPASRKLAAALADTQLEGEAQELKEAILAAKEHLSKKSMWMYGGDGWAYDIGYGGLDHVIATGEDVNILVVDTEVYSNTGGQASKATQKGAVAPFAASGKKMKKKRFRPDGYAVWLCICSTGSFRRKSCTAFKGYEGSRKL